MTTNGSRRGDVPTADMIRGVVRHGPYNVIVRMTFTNLRRVEAQSYVATIVSRQQYGAVFVSAGPGRWRGRHQLVDEEFGQVRCRRLRHSIDYATDQVAIMIPRGCIGRPAWVKVSMMNFVFRSGETKNDIQEITDNPHTTGHEDSLTRRVYRQALSDQMRRTDPAGDVTADDLSGDDPVLDPEWRNGDITQLRVRHRHYRVTARLNFVELTAGRRQPWMYHTFRFLTSGGGGLELSGTVGVNGGGRQGVWRLSDGRRVKCRGLRHTIDYQAETVRISVPRSCLGRPRWVRVGAKTSSFSEAQEVFRFDDALPTGEDATRDPTVPPDAPTFGPRLRRG